MKMSSVDLWIVGCGKLGLLVAERWLELFPGAVVVGETSTPANHATISRIGAIPRLRSERLHSNFDRVKHILISFPPYSKSPDTAKNYLSEVQAAMSLPETKTLHPRLQFVYLTLSPNVEMEPPSQSSPRVVLISSTSVYGAPPPNANTHFIVSESSPVAGPSNPEYASASRTVRAEDMVLQACPRGAVLRLAGLYDRYRGPHMYWLSAAARLMNGVQQSQKYSSLNLQGEGLINLIHYKDAADVALKVLTRGLMGDVYLGCDDHPISRREIINSAVRAGVMPELDFQQVADKIFQSPHQDLFSKVCNANLTKRVLDW
eukprot:CAMPEP_0114485840 /NCGR_PEP_ID=MMETSP0104-20121206/20160_1 /TAXON_ID=37642 ORGANISM="Paraphysomonas imperforata, Strain PA2" /NCGR_SAMPLE_ID=MMETSP0104 /ASSEMBLY_ACC=CAM_ASM_000202 /LENGTH=317 /DNA_ID=CAMNT_0001661979 /DNA_START=213 /DNA_END=1164 /DNA_ORIENTATION=-